MCGRGGIIVTDSQWPAGAAWAAGGLLAKGHSASALALATLHFSSRQGPPGPRCTRSAAAAAELLPGQWQWASGLAWGRRPRPGPEHSQAVAV